MSKAAINILCMKWGQKYGPEYVNRLYSMVSRNLSRKFRFICLTDDTEGLLPNIETFPIPSLPVQTDDDTSRKRVQAWKKLTTFVDPLYDITGECLFLDLDVIIVDNIDCFFEVAGEFFIINEWAGYGGNSSVYRFTAGEHADLVDHFCCYREEIVSNVENEQGYLSQHMERKGLLNYWPEDWCISYRRQCLPKNRLARWFLASKKPNVGKIIIFHGAPNPDEAIAGKGDRFYRRLRPARWLLDYWY